MLQFRGRAVVNGGTPKRRAVATEAVDDTGAERVIALVGGLDVPDPWDLRALLNALAVKRGKPIHLVARGGLSGYAPMCGMWIGREHDDIIVYDSETSCYHAEQIVLHELGHLLLHHCQWNQNQTRGMPRMESLVPDLDPGMVQHVMRRNLFEDDQESEAELFASLLMSHRRPLTSRSRLLGTFLRR
jgi:hypothetical protein